MSRASEPLLQWLRRMMEAKGLNVAAVAKAADLKKARLRKVLVGSGSGLGAAAVRSGCVVGATSPPSCPTGSLGAERVCGGVTSGIGSSTNLSMAFSMMLITAAR